MDVIYPKNTPKIVKSGEAQFVNKELLIKLINENGMNATYVSKHVFFDLSMYFLTVVSATHLIKLVIGSNTAIQQKLKT